MSTLSKTCNRVIEYSFYLLFFLVPLIMTPWNYELFEFNKMLLVYFLTAIIVGTWLIKMVMAKKFLFKRSFWDIPLLIFLISQFLSLLISIDKHTSLWGYYSRFNGGLISIVCYLLLYWAFVSNMDKIKTLNVIRYTLISAALVAAYGIAEHFGIDAKAWVQDVQSRVFSTLGQPNWLAAWLVALIPITMALFINEQDNLFERICGKGKKLWTVSLIYIFLFIILFLCLLYTKSRSGILGFAVAFVVFWGLIILSNLKKIKKIFKPLIIFGGLILVLAILVGTPWTPSIFNLKKTPPKTETIQNPAILISESSDIRKVVWKGALEIWKHSPVFGTGVETFAYSYYWYRPREHNDLSEWDFLYNKAHNEYLNYAATTGTFGLFSYLLLIGWFIVWSLKKLKIKSEKLKVTIKNSKFKEVKLLTLNSNFALYTLNFALLSGFISILVTNFFGFSVVAVNLLFFLFPALSFTLVSPSPGVGRVPPSRWNRSYTLGIWQWFVSGGILVLTFYLLFLTFRYWSADTHFALGDKLDKSSQTNQAFLEYQKAVELRPEPIYEDSLGVTTATLAVSAFQLKQATLSAQLVDYAIKESNQALTISPYNVNFWKNRTRLFYALSEIDPKYNQEALKSLLRASELAPTDAKISYNLGVLYAKLGQQQTAIQTLEKTVQLKPNYDQARYALGLFYEQKNEINKAKEQYQYIIEKINPDYEPALEKLKKLK